MTHCRPFFLLLISLPLQVSGQVTPNPNPASNQITITSSTDWNDVDFDNFGTITIQGGAATLTNLEFADLRNRSGGLVEVLGTFVNEELAGIANQGQLQVSVGGVLENAGFAVNQFGGAFSVDGLLNNQLTGELGNSGALTIATGGTLSNAGSLTNNLGGTLDINGQLANSNFVENWSAATLSAGGWVDNTGFIVNHASGVFQVSGTVDNQIAGLIINAGSFTNTQDLTNAGILNNQTGATLYNDGTMMNTATGWISNYGTIDNSTLSSFANYGSLDNFGTIISNGVFQNFGMLAGDGAFVGQLQDNGLLTPGSAGGLFVNGDFVKTGGVFNALISGPAHAFLDVVGDVTLSGMLSVQGSNFSEPEYEIINVGGQLIGEFDGLVEGSFVGQFGQSLVYISYAGGDGNDVVLQVLSVPEPAPLFCAAVICLAFVAALCVKENRGRPISDEMLP